MGGKVKEATLVPPEQAFRQFSGLIIRWIDSGSRAQMNKGPLYQAFLKKKFSQMTVGPGKAGIEIKDSPIVKDRLFPSPQDLKLTRSLFLVCGYMQIQLLDHLIIGDGAYSFADNGLMESIGQECRAAVHGLQ